MSEKNFGMGEVQKALKDGRLLEMFGTGTACVVSPIKEIVFKGDRIQIPTVKDGAPITMSYFKQLQDIQVPISHHLQVITIIIIYTS